MSYLFIVHDLLITGSSRRGISDSTSPSSNRAGGSGGNGGNCPPKLLMLIKYRWIGRKKKRQGLWKQGEGGQFPAFSNFKLSYINGCPFTFSDLLSLRSELRERGHEVVIGKKKDQALFADSGNLQSHHHTV